MTSGANLDPPRNPDLPPPGLACGAPTLAGGTCTVAPVLGGARCYQHSSDPEIAAERSLSRRLGGLTSALNRILPPDTPVPRIDSPEAVRSLVATTIHQAQTGKIAPSIAHVVFVGLGVALRLEELALDHRIAKLEKLLARRGR